MNIKKSVTGMFGTNCYLLEDKNVAIIIDPGEATTEIIEFASQNRNKEHKAILLTHCHFDHIGGVLAVKEIFDAQVIIGHEDEKGLADGCINASQLMLGNTISICADKTVADKDVLRFGDIKIEVIATPGHTKGSVCYRLGDVIFSGDTLFKLSIGRYDLPTASANEMRQSLEKLKGLDGDFKVYSGHGEETTLEFERKNNMYLKG